MATTTTTATNQALLRPTPQTVKKGKSKRTSPAESQRKKAKFEAAKPLLHRNESSSGSSARSGLVDLVVEDTSAEETARVRARKEGGPGWNEAEPKRYIRQYPPEVAGEEIKKGFEPPAAPSVDRPATPHASQGGGEPEGARFSIGDDDDDDDDDDGEEEGDRRPVMPNEDSPWRSDDGASGGAVEGDSTRDLSEIYGRLDERDVWGNH